MSHSISDVLLDAQQKLATISQTPRLDAELLLAHVLNVSRPYLYAHAKESLAERYFSQFAAFLERRLQGEPMAYVLGNKEFWSLKLLVSKDTLIPRPETELLVQLTLLLLPQQEGVKIADLGVGSGAIAIALASERPKWQIHGTEISANALEIAHKNLKLHGIQNVTLNQGSWCEGLIAKNYQAIVSNPPYIAENDPHLAELIFEPKEALVAGDGLAAIRLIISQARDYLAKDGWLLIEHGYQQQDAVIALMLEFGYLQVEAYRDVFGQPRVVVSQWQR